MNIVSLSPDFFFSIHSKKKQSWNNIKRHTNENNTSFKRTNNFFFMYIRCCIRKFGPSYFLTFGVVKHIISVEAESSRYVIRILESQDHIRTTCMIRHSAEHEPSAQLHSLARNCF